MKLVNIIPESFQEYEDHLSIVLFSFGCNFRCSYCYNFDYISNPENILDITPCDAITKYVTPLTDSVVLLGGEPCLYKRDVLEVARFAKSVYNLDVKLFTNGSNPDIVLEGLLANKLDSVSIDFKVFDSTDIVDFKNTGFDSNSYRENIKELLTSIKTLGLDKKVEVRTTQSSKVSNEELNKISDFCGGLGIKHLVQQDVSEHYREIGLL
jgi:pyruvate formate lyase activating enzyme